MILSEEFPYEKWSFGSRKFLGALSEEDYDALLTNNTEKEYRRGQIIFQQGSSSEVIYFVKEGTVKKWKDAGGGKEVVLYIAGVGELFGYHTIISGKPYPDHAVAVENCKLVVVPPVQFKTMLDTRPEFKRAFDQCSEEDLNVIGNYCAFNKSGQPVSNLARVLLVVGYKRNIAHPNPQQLEISISRTDLSNLLDLSNDTIGRYLSDFQKEGMLVKSGSNITLLDNKGLIKVANFSFLKGPNSDKTIKSLEDILVYYEMGEKSSLS